MSYFHTVLVAISNGCMAAAISDRMWGTASFFAGLMVFTLVEAVIKAMKASKP